MKTVFKYPVPRRRQLFSLILPVGFKFLRFSFQGEELFMWAEVLKDGPTKEYSFSVHGTGQDILPQAEYLGTYDDGPFVFHIYRA